MDWRGENEAYKGNSRGTIRFTDVVETGVAEGRKAGSKVPAGKRRAKRRAKRKAQKHG
jgi:hypothetical protein